MGFVLFVCVIVVWLTIFLYVLIDALFLFLGSLFDKDEN